MGTHGTCIRCSGSGASSGAAGRRRSASGRCIAASPGRSPGAGSVVAAMRHAAEGDDLEFAASTLGRRRRSALHDPRGARTAAGRRPLPDPDHPRQISAARPRPLRDARNDRPPRRCQAALRAGRRTCRWSGAVLGGPGPNGTSTWTTCSHVAPRPCSAPPRGLRRPRTRSAPNWRKSWRGPTSTPRSGARSNTAGASCTPREAPSTKPLPVPTVPAEPSGTSGRTCRC